MTHTHTDNLDVIENCRNNLTEYHARTWRWEPIARSALTGIEDTLNRHAPVVLRERLFIKWTACKQCRCNFPCIEYRTHVTTLHEIATALGVDFVESTA